MAAMIVRSDPVRRYSLSATALLQGIDNTPTDPTIIQRLQWMATQEPLVTAVLHEVEPLAIVTSAYRCPQLNAAVGGVPTSYHQQGLALDFGGVSDDLGAVQYMKENADRLPATLRLVLVEVDHIHIEFFDPLGILDAGTNVTRWESLAADGSYSQV